jgi:L-galactose dehydrogenase
MQMTTLGRTGLKVSVASLGGGGKSRLGQTRGATFEHSVNVVKYALDNGVNLIDTAVSYQTEPIVGEAIKGRRDKVVISTKLPIYESGTAQKPVGRIQAPELRRRLEGSLRALGTDYVDILHLHGPLPDQYDYCKSEFVPELLKFKEEGKVRHLALSENWNRDKHHEVLELAMADDIWDVFMIGYNFLNQTAAKSLLPATQKKKIGTMCMFAVRGPLADKATAKAKIDKLIESGEIDGSLIDRDDPLGFLTAPGVATSLTDAAYRFCRYAPGIDVVVTGTGSIDHLAENIRSIDSPPLPAPVLEKLHTLFAKVWSDTAEP